MFRISLRAWRPGLNSVRLVKAIRQDAQVPLGTARSLVDRFLAGKPVDVAVEGRRRADHLVAEAQHLGVDVLMEELPAKPLAKSQP